MLDPTSRLEQLRSWYSKHTFEWITWLATEHRYCDSQALTLRLLESLPTFQSTDELGFVEEAKSFLRSEIFDDAYRRQLEKLSMSELAQQLAIDKPKRADTKEMVWEQHGHILYIKMDMPISADPTKTQSEQDFLVWTIGSEWKGWVDVLWPCYLKKDYRLGWYLAKSTKRQLRGGGWLPCDVAVHHLFTCALHGESVRAADNSMLNYTSGNLIIVDNSEKNVTDPDMPPRAFQLNVDISGLDEYRPAKKVKTNDDNDENGEKTMKAAVSVGMLRQAWGFNKREKGIHGARHNWLEETA
jgi:hypothetical protein